MFDHELTVAIQQERERAIREAVVRHQFGWASLTEGRSLLGRLRDLVLGWRSARGASSRAAIVEASERCRQATSAKPNHVTRG